jgi:hypothetical protein
MASRHFQCWKFITRETVIVKLPLHSLKAEELYFKKMDYCAQGNQVILEFTRKSKDPIQNITNEEIWRRAHLQKEDSIWR